jgi:16S rRNA (uracil1498-N3)-methyltransferase
MSESSHRILIDRVALGLSPLSADAMRHVVRVLRLGEGDLVRVFDTAGRTGHAALRQIDGRWMVEVGEVQDLSAAPDNASPAVHIASAIPKGDRADWLVEKLGELGVARWVPLRTERSVVHPEGVEKFNRWRRLSEQAARQCGRPGVMEIAELTPLPQYLNSLPASTLPLIASLEGAQSAWPSLAPTQTTIAILIGPEGDFSPTEYAALKSAGCIPVSLGLTVLRVETAAMVAATLASRASLVRPPLSTAGGV